MISRETGKWSLRQTISSTTQQNESDSRNSTTLTPTVPLPIKLPIENCLNKQTINCEQNILSTPNKKNLIDDCLPSPINGRRLSTTSTSSLLFSTPNTSFSRTTISNTTLTPRNLFKNDCETQLIYPSNIDMINQLILHLNENYIQTNYNTKEVAKKLFYQTNNTCEKMNSLNKKQILHIGRYEIEILFPINYEKV